MVNSLSTALVIMDRSAEVENQCPLSPGHCEYPKGAWQSKRENARLLHFVRNDNFLYRDSV